MVMEYIEELQSKNKKLSAELQLRRQLQRYVQHDGGCNMHICNPTIPECTCGLSDLQAKLKELEGV